MTKLWKLRTDAEMALESLDLARADSCEVLDLSRQVCLQYLDAILDTEEDAAFSSGWNMQLDRSCLS